MISAGNSNFPPSFALITVRESKHQLHGVDLSNNVNINQREVAKSLQRTWRLSLQVCGLLQDEDLLQGTQNCLHCKPEDLLCPAQQQREAPQQYEVEVQALPSPSQLGRDGSFPTQDNQVRGPGKRVVYCIPCSKYSMEKARAPKTPRLP